VETVQEPAEPFVERILMAGILVRPEVARAIGHWLIEKADEADMIGKENLPPGFLQ
jgi:hypothetical protein